MNFLAIGFGIVWLVDLFKLATTTKISFLGVFYHGVIGILLIFCGIVIFLRDQEIKELQERLGIKREL